MLCRPPEIFVTNSTVADHDSRPNVREYLMANYITETLVISLLHMSPSILFAIIQFSCFFCRHHVWYQFSLNKKISSLSLSEFWVFPWERAKIPSTFSRISHQFSFIPSTFSLSLKRNSHFPEFPLCLSNLKFCLPLKGWEKCFLPLLK